MNPFVFKMAAESRGLTVVSEKGLAFAWRVTVSDGCDSCVVTFHLDGRTQMKGSNERLNNRVKNILAEI
jgi:hypothetical protein